jgi:hypothetical protein
MNNTENVFSKAPKIDKIIFINGQFAGRYISLRTCRCKANITLFFAAYLMHPISCLAFPKFLTYEYSELIQSQIMITQKNPNENLNAGWK